MQFRNKVYLVVLLLIFVTGAAVAEKLTITNVGMEPSVPPSPGAFDFHVESELERCCGISGGGRFVFYLRWQFTVDNGARLITGLQPVYAAPPPIRVLFSFHFDGNDAVGTRLAEGSHSYQLFVQYVRLRLDQSDAVVAEHIFDDETRTGAFQVDTVAPRIRIEGVLNDQIYTQARTVHFTATDTNLSSVSATLNGGPFTTGSSVSAEGIHDLVVNAADSFGNSSSKTVRFRIWTTPPPDPQTIAPAIDQTVATSIYTATEFLYKGANPVQIGVDPDTIVPQRTVLLRGKAVSRQGNPIAGAKIAILNHPEFGATATRSDGRFDMVVNGGTTLTVVYEHPDYIMSQRSITVPWEDWREIDEVVLIPYDTNVTVINFTQPMEVARGSAVSDDDGNRQATLLFPQQIATMILPDGTEEPLPVLHVRATEFTVGPNGPAAMPAALPPTTVFTYAVEWSVDEAVASGATEVRFASPLIHYLENFLDVPVGTIVPAGYYDRQRGVWVGSDNGLVVKIVNITSGLADFDITGDGITDNDLARTQIGLTDLERAQTALLYSAGQSLWRVPLTHFTPHDFNLPTPAVQQFLTDVPLPQGPLPCPDKVSRSIIECQNQTLGENIDVAGTPFYLHYQSDRQVGSRSSHSIKVPLSGGTLPANLYAIDFRAEIGGRVFGQSFSALPNQRHSFTWDSFDVYGRRIQGSQPVQLTIDYIFADPMYNQPPSVPGSWEVNSGSPLPTSQRLVQVGISPRTSRHKLGTVQFDPQFGIGGWTFNVHHVYDPSEQQIYYGDGRRKTAGIIINTIAGNGGTGYTGDGGLATEAEISQPIDLDVAADGTVYFTDGLSIRKVTPDGIIHTVFQDPDYGAFDLAVSPSGTLYYTDGLSLIRALSPDGTQTNVTGFGFFDPIEGILAVDSYLPGEILGIDVGPDGSLYIASETQLWKIATNGRMYVVAGTGVEPNCSSTNTLPCGIPGPARQAQVLINDVAVAADGTIYVTNDDPSWVLRIDTGGRISLMSSQFNEPIGIDVASDASVYASDFNGVVRRIGTDGTIATVVGSTGTGSHCNPAFGGDGGPPLAARCFISYLGVTFGPDGNLYLSDLSNYRIRRVSFPAQNQSQYRFPSDDGSEIFVFDANGKHLQTLDSLTGSIRYSFVYDAVGRLASVTDVFGNATVIQRDSAGNPTAVVSAYGQVNSISTDTNGYLASVTNPEGENTTLSYHSGGLLATMTDPGNGIHSYTFDSLGRLTRDEDPASGFVALSRSEAVRGHTVTLTDSLGRVDTYMVNQPYNANEQRTETDANGLITTSSRSIAQSVTTTSPDGTVTATVLSPDPRFGMQSPLLASLRITTPAGLVSTIGETAQAQLSNPQDALSLISLTKTVNVNGRLFTSLYDAFSRTLTATSPQGRQSVSMIDTLGRIEQTQAANLAASYFAYDNRGRLSTLTTGSGGQGRTVSMTYDANGFLETITDPLQRTVSFQYDAVGRITDQQLPDGRLIRYFYDAKGNLQSVTPPGRPQHTFTYTPVDLTDSYDPPNASSGTDVTRSFYNTERQVTQISRPDGTTVSFGYDTGGRLSSVTSSRGTTSFAYHVTKGTLTSISAPGSVTLSFTYDGSLLKSMAWSGALSGSLSWTFDTSFRLTSESVNNANAVNFTYDNDSLLTQAGSLVVSRNAQTGFIDAATLGVVSDARAYDTFGEITSYDSPGLFSDQFIRDQAGRITQKTESIQGQVNVYDYTYDAVGRLTDVVRNGTGSAHYDFDANSNRLPGNYDDQDRLLQYGNLSFTYTANGDLASKTDTGLGQNTSYSYDEFGNLISAVLPGGTQIEYIIDGGNRRVGKKVNGVKVQGYLYRNGLQIAAELDATNNVISRFVYGTRGNVPDYMVKSGITYRIVSDHLGSPRLVVDSTNGTVAQRMDYDQFGSITFDSNPGFQPFGFAGGLYDQHSKLVRFGARDYDPATGRWTAKDPILFAGGDTNLYGYVLNDPINFIDPEGLESDGGILQALGIILIAAGANKSTFIQSDHAPLGDLFEDAISSLGPEQQAVVCLTSGKNPSMSRNAKRRLAKELGDIPRSAQPVAQGGSNRIGRWWEYVNSSNEPRIVVEHPDKTVHVGIPKPQSTHRVGGPPKFYDCGCGHVGE